jgi:hypothetical protein
MYLYFAAKVAINHKDKCKSLQKKTVNGDGKEQFGLPCRLRTGCGIRAIRLSDTEHAKSIFPSCINPCLVCLNNPAFGNAFPDNSIQVFSLIRKSLYHIQNS